MHIQGRHAGVAALVLVGVMGISGCVMTDTGYQPLDPQLAGNCPTCARGGVLSRQMQPMPEGLPGGGVVQTAYQTSSPGAIQSPATMSPPVAMTAPVEGEIVGGPYRPLAGRLNGLRTGMHVVDSPVQGEHCCPRELTPVSHPPYTVAPPDVLLLEALRAVPKGPYRLEPLEVLQISVTGTLPNQPISGGFMITPEGNVNLGFDYGSVRVGGLTIDEAEVAIRKKLSDTLKNPQVSLAIVQFRGVQQIRGEHLVRPDGTISLGAYGSVYVAGMTLGQVKCVVEKYLSEYLVNPQISVDMLSYNSKRYYVIYDGGGYGMQVFTLPVTGNETVLDAIGRVGGLAPVSSTKKIVLARPSPAHLGCNQILPVDWKAVLHGSTATNYQIFPGDRVYVYPDCLIETDNYLAKLLAPVERIFGITLLGTTTVQTLRGNFNNAGFVVAR